MWSSFTDIEDAKRAIYTPYKRGCKFTYSKEIERFDGYSNILDFGCGVGRNLKYLVDNCHNVSAYDFPNMVKMAREYLGAYAEWVNFIEPPLNNLAGYGFDLTIAVVVFQHMHVEDLRNALIRISAQSKELFVCSRGYADDRFNVWKIIREYFEPVNKIDIDDMTEHHQSGLWKSCV